MNLFPWQPRDWTRRLADFVRRVFRGLIEHGALDHAATMSFYFFLGMIPLLVFAGHLLANNIDSFDELTRKLLTFAPRTAVDLLVGQLHAMSDGKSRSLAPLSLLGFLILTSNGVHNLMDVLELVTRAPHRPWWKQRLIAVLSVLGMLEVGAGLSFLLLWVGKSFQVRHKDESQGLAQLYEALRNFAASTWQQLGAIVLFAILLAVGLAIFYRYGVSYPPRVKRRVWPGTFVAIGCWILFSWAFGAYVSGMGQYAVYYGSLATVAIFLVWLYLTSLSILLGAEVNAQLEGLRDPYHSRLRPKKPLAGYHLRPSARADASQTPLPDPLLTRTPGATDSPLLDSVPPPDSFSTPPPPRPEPAPLREARES
ncbi:MAG: YihY/virulence factor BrkB family protein [Myxococcales bacterium]|nr:YihY/virulence factor BrkB family protein [Polyangiaceae bacterium]MDW8250891.1 YihY/virulence factor BrkB family protein [Myxococcales bacterium]